jgi:prevent-host-death family protein
MMKEVPLTEVKDRLSEYLHLAEEEMIIITRHGKLAGVLVGFATEDDWFDYRLEHDERFLERINNHINADFLPSRFSTTRQEILLILFI